MNVLVANASGIAGAILQFGVFFVAAALALSGKGITAGTAIVFVQLLNYALGTIQAFPAFFAGMKASFGLIDKLAGALDKNIPEEGEPIAPHLTEGIAVRHLEYAYEEGKPVLCDVNMEMDAGGCYALVGGSGSGKSTILNLLMASSKTIRVRSSTTERSSKESPPAHSMISCPSFSRMCSYSTAPSGTTSPCSPGFRRMRLTAPRGCPG